MKAVLAWSLLKLFPAPAGNHLSITPPESFTSTEQSEQNTDLDSALVEDETWLQQCFFVTEHLLDTAIDGEGFFWLIDGRDGALKLTRRGTFAVDAHGNLVHTEQGDQVLKRIPGGVSNISIADVDSIVDQKSGAPTRLDFLEITREGHLSGHYQNGDVRDIATLAVLTFEHPRRLRRLGQDLFAATDEAGIASYEGKNILYSGTLEGHAEAIYEEMNLGR